MFGYPQKCVCKTWCMFGFSSNLKGMNSKTKSNGPTKIEPKSKGGDAFANFILLPTYICTNKPNMHGCFCKLKFANFNLNIHLFVRIICMSLILFSM